MNGVGSFAGTPFFDVVRTGPARREAITDALRERVLGGVHLGTLEPGARLPSLRTVADEMHADPRLVHSAYRRLAAEGLVRLQPRSGVFVADRERHDDGARHVSW